MEYYYIIAISIGIIIILCAILCREFLYKKKLLAQLFKMQEYAGNVAHELKSPLAAMKVLADSLLCSEDVPNAVYQEFMKDISSQIDRETGIIQDLLLLAKLEQSERDQQFSECKVDILAESIIKQLLPLAEQKNVKILWECEKDMTFYTEEHLVADIISNLLENAIKYNVKDGQVNISVTKQTDILSIVVSDTGIGIPKEKQTHIFERFYRVDKENSRSMGGSGLGLSVCKQEVLALGGAICVESKEGDGSTFTVTLPAGKK